MLFAPHVVRQEKAAVKGERPKAEATEIATSMPTVFRVRTIQTPSGVFGHIRIFTFNVDDPEGFLQEFIQLLGLVPQNGLILDVRDNGGGHVRASELALQALTPRRIVPEPVEFLNTALNLRLCRRHPKLAAWVPSMEEAVEIGATFSRAIPLTPEDSANGIGQQYFGPVVLITNARCYSATDIFAAGFQDHQIGTVLGADENTGAGGANVWTHSVLSSPLAEETATPYAALPQGAGMRVAMRRTLRVGNQSGTPLEDLGVVPDVLHRMTRRDVLEHNADLLARAGELLSARLTHSITVVDASRGNGTLHLKVAVSHVDRLDVFVDGRPRMSIDPVDGQTDITVPHPASGGSVRMDGFASGELVASRRLADSP
jgi:C-terminal processing protease CtpA/Prc